MIPSGVALTAFLVVFAVVWIGPFVVLARRLDAARAAWDAQRAEELELRGRDRAMLARIGAALPARTERQRIGFVVRDGGKHGDGASGVIVIYEPPASDDAARTGREKMRGHLHPPANR